MNEFVGAILAAGRGKRMGLLGEYYPKPLLPVANKPLIVHQLKMLHNLGIRHVFIVVGHNAVEIVRTLGNGEQFGLLISYVEQTMPLGSAHALGQLASQVHHPLIVLLGDYFIHAPGVAKMLERAHEYRSSVMAAKQETNQKALREACILKVDDNGRILQIIEKPKILSSSLKGCGVYVLQPEFFDAVRRTPRTALRDEYELSVAIDLYIESGNPMYAESVIEWDRNFTRPEDVLACNLEWLQQNCLNELYGRNVFLAPGTQVTRSIVGDNATISEPVLFEDSVIFAGTQFKSRQTIKRSLVTPHLVVPCVED